MSGSHAAPITPRPAVIIGGPTAGGKSALALAIAQAHNGCIINADALQIYDDLPILTAQPDAQDHAAAPHLLYGTAHPDDRYSAARWRYAALAAIGACHAAGQLPVITGGTGFYISALLQGLSPIPEVTPENRAAAQAAWEDLGTQGLFDLLQKHDAAAAARLEAENPRRLIRAYEVLLQTGQTLAHWQDVPREGPPADMRFYTIVVSPERGALHARCAARMGLMEKAGMFDEVAAFAARIARGDVAPDAPLTHACGYAPLAAFLRGGMTKDKALELMLADTRQYAKRQQTWFKNQLQADLTLTNGNDGVWRQKLAAFLAAQS